MSAESDSMNSSIILARKLLDVLGIRHAQPWQRVVIVCDVRDALPQIFVKGILDPRDADKEDKAIEGIVRAVKDVVVNDDSSVTIVE